MIESPFLTLVAGETLAAKRRVKLSGTTAVYAGATEIGIGVTEFAVLSGEEVTIRLDNGGGTMEIAAAGEIAAGVPFYPAASGRITATAGGLPLGFTLSAASALDDIINVLRTRVAGELTLGDQIFSDVLEGGSPQGIESISLLPNYPWGTRRITADGRSFKYAKAGTGGVDSEFGAVNTQKTDMSAVAPTQTAPASGAIGSKLIKVTIAASTGPNGDGTLTKDQLKGGYVVIGNGTSQHPQFIQITGNDALAAFGNVNISLATPLAALIVATTTFVEVTPNPYAALRNANVVNSDVVSVLGMPAVSAGAGYSFWLQTWGPCWITSDGNTGKAANSRELFFVQNGSIVSGDGLTYAGKAYQRAGFAMDANALGSSNSPCCMLQISN